MFEVGRVELLSLRTVPSRKSMFFQPMLKLPKSELMLFLVVLLEAAAVEIEFLRL